MPSSLVKVPPHAQLSPVQLVSPGFRGLNLVQSGALLSPAFATEAMNMVLDRSGRLAVRSGVTNLTTTPITGSLPVKTIFEYAKGDGTVANILAWDGGISTSFTNPQGSDISGAVVDTSGVWQFQNFNDKVIGFQDGQRMIVYTGTGNFAAVTQNSSPTSGGVFPTGGIGLAAFGRVWQARTDGQTIDYSKLLDETRFADADGGGSIDMRKVWTHGSDSIKAIVAYNGALLVFGNRHIVFWVDGRGSTLGLDPLTMYVSDIIVGTGTVSQFTIQPVGSSDLVFLSTAGVQSLRRLQNERSAPMATLSKYVDTVLLPQLDAETVGNIRTAYSALTGLYLLSFPASNTVWVFDMRHRFADEDGTELATPTRWLLTLTALGSVRTGRTYLARTGGKVGEYTGSSDEGTAFRFNYLSPWLELGEDYAARLKILKRITAITYVQNSTTLTFKWYKDFQDDFHSAQTTLQGDGSAEYGVGEYGTDEYNGGLSMRIFHVPANQVGQYFRIGIEGLVTGDFSIRQFGLVAKIGRMASN